MSRVLPERTHHLDLSAVVEGEVIDEWSDVLHCALARHHTLQDGNGLVAADDDVPLQPQLHRREIRDQLPELCSQTFDSGVGIHAYRVLQHGVISPKRQPAVLVVVAEGFAMRVDRRDDLIGVWHSGSLLALSVDSAIHAVTLCLLHRPSLYHVL